MAILSTSLDTTATPISPLLSGDSAITVMMFCNLNEPDPLDVTAGRQYVSIYAVASGDTPNTTNLIANEVPIDAGDTFTFSSERLVLGAGDQIQASTTDSGLVSVTLSYVII
jgi:hypothetical protein